MIISTIKSTDMNDVFNSSILTMTSLQIAEITCKPHSDVLKAIRKMEPAWQRVSQGNFTLSSYKQPQPNGGFKDVPCYLLTQGECLYIATKFNDEARARLVLRWKELEEEKQKENKVHSLQDRLAVGECFARMMNMNEASKSQLMRPILEEYGFTVPDYVKSNGVVKALSLLLKQYSIGMSSQAFNAILVANGYLTTNTRPSKKGGEHKFKTITKKGLEFGENGVNEHNQQETQPLWYVDKFEELCRLNGVDTHNN